MVPGLWARKLTRRPRSPGSDRAESTRLTAAGLGRSRGLRRLLGSRRRSHSHGAVRGEWFSEVAGVNRRGDGSVALTIPENLVQLYQKSWKKADYVMEQ